MTRQHVDLQASGAEADSGTSAGWRPDSELLDACRAGESDAWEVLVARYERLIFSVASRNGLSREDAADVTQSTFLVLLESIRRRELVTNLPSWLMTVARRDAWRVNTRRAREAPYVVADVGHDPSTSWDQIAALTAALDQLGSPCQDLLWALYFDDSEPSYVAIARRLGRSVGGIGPLRGRCLERLRRLLDDEGWAA